MAFVLSESQLVQAPVERVWEVICDLDAYPEWNPFVVGARSSLAPGEPIVMRVRLLPPIVLRQTETILECVPGERLVYGLEGGLIHSRRTHGLSAEGTATTRYLSDFRLDGRLQPLVRALLGRRLEIGFTSMTRALVARAERIERERESIKSS